MKNAIIICMRARDIHDRNARIVANNLQESFKNNPPLTALLRAVELECAKCERCGEEVYEKNLGTSSVVCMYCV